MEKKERGFRFPLDLQFFAEDKEDDIDPSEIEDEEEGVEGEEEAPKEDAPKKAKQSQSENARYAQMRREAEAKAKAEKQARDDELEKAKEESYRKGLREGIKFNPYTEEPIEDDYDLEVYEVQKSLDERGKDPNKDLPRELAKLKREKAEEERKRKEDDEAAKAKEEAERRESISKKQREIKEVREKYGLSQKEMEALLTDPKSDVYKQVSEKGGRWTLDEIFSNYYKPPKETPEERKTPDATPAGTKSGHKPFKDMTDEEYIEYSRKTHGGF